MPAHVVVSGSELGIRLEGGKTSYRPGDTVSGCIYRLEPTTSTSARVTISLHGKSETRVKRSGGYTSKMVYNRFSFFDSNQTTQVLHYDKPLDIQSGGSDGSWPFIITLPKYVDPKAIDAAGIEQKRSYLPLSPDAVAAQPIPPSFNESRNTLGGFVEYYLQAKIEFVYSKGFFTGRAKTKSHEAIMPLQVEYVSPPITDFHLERHVISEHISSPRLAPGMRDTRLSWSQKTKRVFGSSKIPRLFFKIHLDIPTALQLESENSVPFKVGLEPIWSSTSDDIRHVPQEFTLKSLVVRIKPVTELRMTSRSVTYARKPMDIIAEDRVGSLGANIYVQLLAADTYEDPEIVNVGKLMNFSLNREAISRIAMQPQGMKLYPSFTTYNISHQYQLSWELRGEIAGEKIQVDGKHAVTLLPSSFLGDNHTTAVETPGIYVNWHS